MEKPATNFLVNPILHMLTSHISQKHGISCGFPHSCPLGRKAIYPRDGRGYPPTFHSPIMAMYVPACRGKMLSCSNMRLKKMQTMNIFITQMMFMKNIDPFSFGLLFYYSGDGINSTFSFLSSHSFMS